MCYKKKTDDDEISTRGGWFLWMQVITYNNLYIYNICMCRMSYNKIKTWLWWDQVYTNNIDDPNREKKERRGYRKFRRIRTIHIWRRRKKKCNTWQNKKIQKKQTLDVYWSSRGFHRVSIKYFTSSFINQSSIYEQEKKLSKKRWKYTKFFCNWN